MALKPTEVKLLIKHLESESPDVDTLARTILEELDAKRAKEAETSPPWVLLLSDTAHRVYAFGPYPTQNKALKDVEKLAVQGAYVVRKLKPVNDGG